MASCSARGARSADSMARGPGEHHAALGSTHQLGQPCGVLREQLVHDRMLGTSHDGPLPDPDGPYPIVASPGRSPRNARMPTRPTQSAAVTDAIVSAASAHVRPTMSAMTPTMMSGTEKPPR